MVTGCVATVGSKGGVHGRIDVGVGGVEDSDTVRPRWWVWFVAQRWCNGGGEEQCW